MENKWGNKYSLIVIGASTGGPGVVRKILSDFPEDLPVPVAIVQHMPPEFTKGFAISLNEISKLKVIEAGVREIMKAGYAYIAPGDKHIIIKDISGQLVLKQNDDPEYSGHRPSVDKLFLSVTKIPDLAPKTIAVLLTGMGKDGGEGMKALRDLGAFTIAQTQETCVIFGMPGTAVKLGGVDISLNPEEIVPFILKKLRENQQQK
ncbi:MAG TPA: CheB methylesterase domain-containing protein [bacterium]|nr:CheB methylesterase domain-containing protein [bacterium]HOL47614.1 CheB methylesterase domain-containing protein [bacterium]HPQ19414.1 CheB methylesterase domain-containing protein [bacterium]